MTPGRESPTLLVARREVAQALRSKGTKILLAVSVAAVVALVVIARVVSGSDPSTTRVAVIDAAAAGSGAVNGAGDPAFGTDIEVVAVADAAAARRAVDDGDADLAVLADGTIVTRRPVDLGGSSTLAAVVNAVRADVALTRGLGAAGLTTDQIAAVRVTPPPDVVSLYPSAGGADSGRVGPAMVMNVVLFLLLQTYGGWVVQGVTREKASRVVEVLLAAITARQLLVGKLTGIGVVALLHAATLVLAALVTTRVVGLDVLDGFRAGDVAVGAAWFLVGYALYCSAFAAAGALCSRAEDAQGATLPIMVPLLAAYIVSFSAAGGAGADLLVLAFVPPTAALCMPVLYATGVVPVWAMLLSMAMTLAAALGIAVVAGRIYERSVLRTKRVSWRAALRRVR